MRQLVFALLGVLLLALPVMAANNVESTPADDGELSYEPYTGEVWSGPRALLYDNGPLVNCAGCGAGGADESQVQTALGMSIYGFGHQHSLGYLMADDFEVPAGETWTVETMTFFAYQTNSGNTSTITGVYFEIWDGPPPGANLIYGDQTTNTMTATAWSNIYRVLDSAPGTTTRPIMANVATPPAPLILGPGTYWIAWNTDGSGTSGPWAPPITINFECVTGNAMQSLDYGVSYAPATDTGSGCEQGLPFIIEGTGGGSTPVDEGTWGSIKAIYR
jgi:hypothetical protein